MPRNVRVEYAGAVYHVMCRGDRREAIFRDDRDRETFLRTLAEMCGRTGALVHGYVLMSNHYHLLLETPEANLVAGMKWFQASLEAPEAERSTEAGGGLANQDADDRWR